MTTKPLGKIGRYALRFLPVVIVVVGVLAAIPWLKQQNAAVASVLTAAAAIFVMGYSHFLAQRYQRGLDEVEIASQGFASSRGWMWGAMATALLLNVPPVVNWLVGLANMQSTGSWDLSDRGAVRLALIYGFCLVVAMQTLCVIVAAVIWWGRMGGMRERS